MDKAILEALASIHSRLQILLFLLLYVKIHFSTSLITVFVQVDKRAHHNALERKRRDHIKDSFSGLRDSVPSLQGEKVTLSVFEHMSLKKIVGWFSLSGKSSSDTEEGCRLHSVHEAEECSPPAGH
jgi:hypothetical protein